jgi:hypothetical protein
MEHKKTKKSEAGASLALRGKKAKPKPGGHCWVSSCTVDTDPCPKHGPKPKEE